MAASEPQIKFEDGAAYESFMGVWSRSAGEIFLDWLAPPQAMAWLDVGCGNGAFTELLTERTAPARILGVDPSPAQLDYARKRHAAGIASFVPGDAMALPVEDRSFDAAVMTLVIFFVPQPAKGLTEMVRAVKPGGLVAAYAWDIMGGGFPVHVIYEELQALGLPAPAPPSAEVSRMAALTALWTDGGLDHVETKVITVQRRFDDFETLWRINLTGSRLTAVWGAMTPEQRQTLKDNVRARLIADAGGVITCSARAHAIRGQTAR